MADAFLLLVLLLLGIASSALLAADDSSQPDPALLEFLGEWETNDGQWFNPLWILKNMSRKLDDNEKPSSQPYNEGSDND